MAHASFTEPTTDYWQHLHATLPERFASAPPYRFGYPVRLPSGEILVLPLRALPDQEQAVASLIVNQASQTVVSALAGRMAYEAQQFRADVIVGLPTLGLALAPRVASALGQARYVPVGTSRKFWYDDALSEPVASITSPDLGKSLRLDPNLLPLVRGRRALLIDDAISSGATIAAAVRLLAKAGADCVGVVVAMKQTNGWMEAISAVRVRHNLVRSVFGCPLFRRGDDGWWPVAGTEPIVP